jgi:hypothetical protein
MIGAGWLIFQVLALNNGLALTPPMGWYYLSLLRLFLDWTHANNLKTHPQHCISPASGIRGTILDATSTAQPILITALGVWFQ